MAEASTFSAEQAWRSDDGRQLLLLSNTFGRRAHLLKTDEEVTLAVPATVPQHCFLEWDFPVSGWVVVDLPSDFNPVTGAIGLALQDQDVTSHFDPYEIKISQRFDGEDQRTETFAGWRIFTDRNYSEKSRAVEKGIWSGLFATATNLNTELAAFDSGYEKFRRIADLQGFSGDFAAAAKSLQTAGRLAPSPENRFSIGCEQAYYLAENGAEKQAGALVKQLLDEAQLRIATEDLAGMTEVYGLADYMILTHQLAARRPSSATRRHPTRLEADRRAG